MLDIQFVLVFRFCFLVIIIIFGSFERKKKTSLVLFLYKKSERTS